MDWIVERGVEKIPDGISFEEASLVEPLNTCLKAVNQCDPQPRDTVLVLGQGPIGLMFTMLAAQRGARVVVPDTIAQRRYGACPCQCGEPKSCARSGLRCGQRQSKSMTEGRGADIVLVAVSARGIVEEAVRYSRPGARIMLFAQTSDKERIELSGASICVGERSLLGSYSASVDIQREGADLIFQRTLPVHLLISHRFPLDRIKDAFHLALHPTVESLKVVSAASKVYRVKKDMMAAVLYGRESLRVEPVAVPPIGPGDLLVRVHYGVPVGTDVKVFRRGYHAQMIGASGCIRP